MAQPEDATPRTDRRSAASPLTPLMKALENAGVLDGAVHAAQPLMDGLTSNRSLRGALQGAWLGHALHPLMIQVPLGAWISALAVEITGVDPEGNATQLLTGLGILTAPIAVMSGWAELAETGPREKRVGVVHAAVNGGGLTLEVAAWLARRKGNRALALAYSLAALTLVGAGGYLGGHLSVARDVGTKDHAYADA